MKRYRWVEGGGSLVFYIILILVFVAPLLRLLTMSFSQVESQGLPAYALLLQDRRAGTALFNTLIIGLGATAVAVLLGTGLAVVVAYTNVRQKSLIEFLAVIPFIVPSYIITLAWTGLLQEQGMINQLLLAFSLPDINLYSLGGIILVMGLTNTPIVYLGVVNFLRKIPRELEWAARAGGYKTLDILWRISLPQALPAIASGGLLSFLATIDNFAVPAFLGISSGIPVLSTLIYEKAIGFGPSAFNEAAALSVVLSLLAVGGTLLEGRITRGQQSQESILPDREPRIILKDRGRSWLERITLGGLGLLNIVPLATMILSAFLKSYGAALTPANLTLKNFAAVFTNRSIYLAVGNSLFLAGLTCAVCLVGGTALAYLRVRKGSRAAILAEKCAALTYAVPGIVLALAMIFYWVEPLPGVKPGLYGTASLLVIAYITRYLVLQIKGSATTLGTINPDLEEAVRATGRSRLVCWCQVILPLLMRPALASTFLIFVSSLTELSLSSLLAGAGTKTIGLSIFSFQQAGDYQISAAMSTLVVILVIAAYLLIHYRPREKKKPLEVTREPVSGATQPAVS